MNYIHHMTDSSGIQNLDLNLLKVFAAVDKFRHMTKAAEFLNLSQPAVSHAMSRLRLSLNDQLFVKTPSQMVPTPLAKKLSLPIQEILEKIQSEVLQKIVLILGKLRELLKFKRQI